MPRLIGIYQTMFVRPEDVNPDTDEVLDLYLAVAVDQRQAWLRSMSWDDPWYQSVLRARHEELGGRISKDGFDKAKEEAETYGRTPERTVCIKRRLIDIDRIVEMKESK